MGDKVMYEISLRRFLGLYALYARMDLDFLVRDARLSLMAIAADGLSNAASVSGVFLLSQRFGGIGGMSRWDVLFMLGYVTCVTGLYQLFFSGNNTGHISRRIGRGQVDHMLVQPLPLPVQLATEGFIPFTGCQNLLFGIGIIVWALRGAGHSVGAAFAAGTAGYLFVSLAIIIGLSYLFSSLAFKRQVAFEEIASTVVDDLTGMLSNYPLSAMPPPVQWTLITVVPAGLLGWFPACALLGQAPLGLSALYPLAVAVVIWALAALAFKKGLKYYVKYGSNRYNAGGHRR
ncbi:MAG: ABC transporter permease [Clostridiales bacterium]|jgi:ABC-2 type transport system permease protein|nr:ABC transporter permease [Clostridiales bacterium]